MSQHGAKGDEEEEEKKEGGRGRGGEEHKGGERGERGKEKTRWHAEVTLRNFRTTRRGVFRAVVVCPAYNFTKSA